MRTYTEKELDKKIHNFLEQRTQRHPELQGSTRLMSIGKTNTRSANPLEKASIFWSTYIHA